MRAFLIALLLFVPAVGTAGEDPLAGDPPSEDAVRKAVRAQPKLLRISGRIDGSGRIVFTGTDARYEHKHWGWPADLLFDGEPWVRLDQTPPAWRDLHGRLDLTRAWIVERTGRDVIALEPTAEGFDLYLCDSPNGASECRITIAIPRRG